MSAMKPSLVLLIALLCPLVWAEDLSIASTERDAGTDNPAPSDTVLVALPGPPPAAEASPRKAPQTAPSARPALSLPPEFLPESALYLQQQIGHWTLAQARSLLGEPLHQRPAFGESRAVTGQIFAFSDPTKRYKQLELTFARESGVLQEVFAYPSEMTWQDCRRRWGAHVTPADAPKGRKFYSYSDRHLDVLVDPAGKVLSLGLY
jgi:hypothetical protein